MVEDASCSLFYCLAWRLLCFFIIIYFSRGLLMEPSSLLSKQIRLPSLRLKYFAYALLLVVLPNLLFWILAGLTGTARPIINLDYIAAAALFALGWKPAKWAGGCVFGLRCCLMC